MITAPAFTQTFLVGAGLIAAMTALFEIVTRTRYIGATPLEGTLEFLLLAVPAVGLVYAGYWLRIGDFDPEAVWHIGVLAVGGALVAAALTAVLVRFGPIPAMGAEAAFVLFVATSTEGSLLGVLAGTFAVTDRQFRRERSVADELETLQALIRHDVRNRLTIIGGHLTMVTEAADVPAHRIDVIETQLEAIESVLADTDVATEALRSSRTAKAVDLADVVRQQVAVLRNSYDGVTVTTDLPNAAWVSAADVLGPVLDNVLSNAVQHHDGAAPKIAVTATVDDDRVRLAVADDGPGIPPAKRADAFEPGVGAGTGMGLYLVRTVVESYGGTVTLEANEPRGTIVSITLPRAVN